MTWILTLIIYMHSGYPAVAIMQKEFSTKKDCVEFKLKMESKVTEEQETIGRCMEVK